MILYFKDLRYVYYLRITQIVSLVIPPKCFKSLKYCTTNVRRWIMSSTVRIVAFRLFGNKALPETTVPYCELGLLEKEVSEKL